MVSFDLFQLDHLMMCRADHFILIVGTHNAANFANMIVDYLRKYELTKKLSAMTADNISTNAAIGRIIGTFSDIENFDHTK